MRLRCCVPLRQSERLVGKATGFVDELGPLQGCAAKEIYETKTGSLVRGSVALTA